MVLDARIAIADYPLFVSTVVPTSVARIAIGEYSLMTPMVAPTSDARIAIADFPTGTDTPEKLHVWNADTQQWVHEPRYVWNETTQTWNSIS